jgi:hypothetical protein
MVVHRLDAPPLPDELLQPSQPPGASPEFVVEAADADWTEQDPGLPPDWPGCSEIVLPVTWEAWQEGELFGLPELNLPPVRFEGMPDGDPIADISPVLAGEWILRVSVQRDGDELVPVGLDLRPRPGAKISARVLRTLGFGAVLKAANDVLLGRPHVAATFGDRWAQPVEQPGRAGRKDAFYAEWARRYVDALATAPRRPIALLIEEAAERDEHVTRGEIAARLTVARQRGLLTEAPSGQAGGELTDKARRVLGIDEEGTSE